MGSESRYVVDVDFAKGDDETSLAVFQRREDGTFACVDAKPIAPAQLTFDDVRATLKKLGAPKEECPFERIASRAVTYGIEPWPTLRFPYIDIDHDDA